MGFDISSAERRGKGEGDSTSHPTPRVGERATVIKGDCHVVPILSGLLAMTEEEASGRKGVAADVSILEGLDWVGLSHLTDIPTLVYHIAI